LPIDGGEEGLAFGLVDVLDHQLLVGRDRTGAAEQFSDRKLEVARLISGVGRVDPPQSRWGAQRWR
jgi:hypothetical protein